MVNRICSIHKEIAIDLKLAAKMKNKKAILKTRENEEQRQRTQRFNCLGYTEQKNPKMSA